MPRGHVARSPGGSNLRTGASTHAPCSTEARSHATTPTHDRSEQLVVQFRMVMSLGWRRCGAAQTQYLAISSIRVAIVGTFSPAVARLPRGHLPWAFDSAAVLVRRQRGAVVVAPAPWRPRVGTSRPRALLRGLLSEAIMELAVGLARICRAHAQVGSHLSGGLQDGSDAMRLLAALLPILTLQR